MARVSAVNEEHLKKQRYPAIYQVCSLITCFSHSSFLAHENLRLGIHTERSGVYTNRLYRNQWNP